MDVNNNVSSYNSKTTSTSNKTKNSRTTDTTNARNTAETTPTEDNAYVVEVGKDDKNTEAKSYKTDAKAVASFKSETERKAEQLINLVTTLFGKQADKDSYQNMSLSDMRKAIESGAVSVDAETIANAKAEIGEDGYYGVKQTSDRLVGFAKALSGGDPKQIEGLRDSIIKGFEDAEKKWGGELPQICKDTFNATMDKLDSWAKESGITLSEVDRM